ncbi:MAG: PQQ-dependent sugar dehydrogenase, partial [Bacteroidota bacterium]
MTYFYPIFRKNFLFALLFLSLFLIAAVPMIMAPGLNNPEAVGPFLNDAFPSGVSSGPGNVTFDDYASNLVFNTVMGAAQAPRSNRFYVIERNGKIFSFDKTQTNPAMTLFRNMENIVWKGQDSGLLGIAFHPDFNQVGSPNKNYLYVFYVNETAGVRYIRVSRLTKQNNGDVFVPNSEQILINQRLDFTGSNLHRGGGLVFGNDGFLYISIGDLGAMNQSQNITDRLLGGILRIDVDKRGGGISHPIRRSLQQLGQGTTDNYFIPNDNPWISTNGSNFEEYYAIGCRSPHKMSKDVATGTIFIGNVGSNSGNKKEEINVLSKGANFGWPFREGTTDRPDLMARPSNIIGQLKDPMLFYQHGGGSVCIIGGYVYRGSQYPALQGKYVFGDFGSRNIWSVNLDGSNQQLIASIPNQFPTFAQDTDGEIYIGRMGGHPLLRLNVANNPGGNGSIPQFLSQTGAFADVANLVPAQGVIPYDVNTSLWSDGSEKYRWAVIPNDGTHNVVAEQVDFDDRGDWDFPRGTVFIKHFELALDERNPSQTKKLETRFIILDGPGSFYGLTYKWNNAGTDAELLSNGLSETYNIIDQSGGSRSQTWRYPSRSECLTCHTQASGGVLGPQTSQFNGGMVYPSTGINANQLETWAHLGIFKYSRQFVQPINATEISRYITSRSINDNSASLEQRARSYLDANCSSCHRPNGGPRAEFDARIESGLDLQNLINGPVINELGIAGAKLVFPGNAEKSIIYKRINQANTGDAMPPLAKNRVHTEGANLIRDWINALPASGGGWNAKYYSDTGLQNLAFERVDRAIDFNWDDVSPKDGFQSNNYSVSWTTQLTARFAENYTFALKADDGVRMWVDGQKIIDDWSVHPPQFALGSVFLSPGAHDIKVEYFQGGGNARVSLYWQSPSQSWELVPAMYTNPGGAPPPPPPGGGNGLQATYYNNIDFTGNSISRVDPTINFNCGTVSPDADIGNDTYSDRWEGYL